MPVNNPPQGLSLTFHGTDIITNAASANATWTDIDISSIVGAKECLVGIGYGNAGFGEDTTFRRNGHTIDTTIPAENTGAAGMVADGDVDERGYVIVMTDSNGVIEYYSGGSNHTVEVIWSIG